MLPACICSVKLYGLCGVIISFESYAICRNAIILNTIMSYHFTHKVPKSLPLALYTSSAVHLYIGVVKPVLCVAKYSMNFKVN